MDRFLFTEVIARPENIHLNYSLLSRVLLVRLLLLILIFKTKRFCSSPIPRATDFFFSSGQLDASLDFALPRDHFNLFLFPFQEHHLYAVQLGNVNLTPLAMMSLFTSSGKFPTSCRLSIDTGMLLQTKNILHFLTESTTEC